MFEVSVYLTKPSVDVSQLAGRLGGICTEESDIRDGIRLCDCGWTTKQACLKKCESLHEKQAS